MIPCKNNDRIIGEVLESIRGLADQLVVVDSGSTDTTMDLVNACRSWDGDDACEVLLIETHWRGYVKTKQLALEACSCEYTLWLDSDEPVSPELAKSIRCAMDQGVDSAKMNRVVRYRGRMLTHCWQPEHRVRLVRTKLVQENKARFNGIDPHDYLEIDPPNKVEFIEGTLIHDSFESFAQHLENQRKLSYTSAKSMHEMGRQTSAWKIMSSPPGAFLKQLILKGSWRDGYAGWLCAGTSAAGALMKHMMLYEMNHSFGSNLRSVIQEQHQPSQESGVLPLFDSVLGELHFEPQMEEFEGAIEFHGMRVRVAVHAADGVLEDSTRSKAHKVTEQLDDLVREAKLFASKEYLDFWNSSARGADRSDHTVDDFINELEFLGFTVCYGEGVNFEFECHDVMPGHGITVSTSINLEMIECACGG